MTPEARLSHVSQVDGATRFDAKLAVSARGAAGQNPHDRAEKLAQLLASLTPAEGLEAKLAISLRDYDRAVAILITAVRRRLHEK